MQPSEQKIPPIAKSAEKHEIWTKPLQDRSYLAEVCRCSLFVQQRWRGERDSADTPKGVPSAERRRFAPRVNRQPRKLCRILKRFGGCGSNPHNNKDPETAKMPSRGLVFDIRNSCVS